MTSYNIVASTDEATVVAEYTPDYGHRSDKYQGEAQLEAELIRQLSAQGYEYLAIHDQAGLMAICASNWKVSTTSSSLIANGTASSQSALPTPTRALSKRPARSRMTMCRCCGATMARPRTFTCSTKRISTTTTCKSSTSMRNRRRYPSRYDVTILVNGLPLVHVEAETPRRGHSGSLQPDQPLPARQLLGGDRVFLSMCRFLSSPTERTPNTTATPRAAAISGRQSRAERPKEQKDQQQL